MDKKLEIGNWKLEKSLLFNELTHSTTELNINHWTPDTYYRRIYNRNPVTFQYCNYLTIEAIKKILSSIPSNSDIKIPKDISVIYKAKGCKKCHNIGYRGRIGIFEFLSVTEPIKKLILSESASFEIQKKAQEEGMITLIQDAVINIIEGKTSLEEVERIIGSLEE